MNGIHIPSPCWLNNTQCNFQRGIQISSPPNFYHSTLSLCDNLTVCFHLGQHNSLAYIASLLHSHRNFRYLHRSLTPTHKFRITPRVSYTDTEIRDISPSLLHPHRNSGYHPGSLTPIQKFRDITPGLLHPHINSGYLPRSLTPTQDLLDTTAGLLHPNSRFLTLGD